MSTLSGCNAPCYVHSSCQLLHHPTMICYMMTMSTNMCMQCMYCQQTYACRACPVNIPVCVFLLHFCVNVRTRGRHLCSHKVCLLSNCNRRHNTVVRGCLCLSRTCIAEYFCRCIFLLIHPWSLQQHFLFLTFANGRKHLSTPNLRACTFSRLAWYSNCH